MNDSSFEKCAENVPYTLQRFTIIIISSTIAAIGLVCNCILAITFYGMKQKQHNFAAYLGTLAVCDAVLCNCYIFLFGGDAIAQYYQNVFLYRCWVYYTIPLFCISQMVQIANPYILIAATSERLMRGSPCTVGVSNGCPHTYPYPPIRSYFLSPSGRNAIIATILSFCICLKLSGFWEMTVREYKQCSKPIGTIGIDLTALKMDFTYHIFDFYVISILQLFVPFTVLLVLNILIIRNTARENTADLRAKSMSVHRFTKHAASVISDGDNDRRASRPILATYNLSSNFFHRFSLIKKGAAKGKQKLRKARYTMVAIVTSYLVCNSLNFIVGTMEKLRIDYFLMNEHGEATDFYTHSSDLTSFLLMLNSSLRLFLYLSCDREIRDNVARLIACSRHEEERSTVDVESERKISKMVAEPVRYRTLETQYNGAVLKHVFNNGTETAQTFCSPASVRFDIDMHHIDQDSDSDAIL